jgi:hypothetical protein
MVRSRPLIQTGRALWIRIALMRIRMRIRIRIYNQSYKHDPNPTFHFDVIPDPNTDPAYYFDADPDPPFQFDADPC